MTWSDPLWLGSYVGLAVGIVGLGRGRALRTTEGLLDVLTVAVVTATVVWHFALTPVIDSAETTPLLVVDAAFPALDLLLIVLVTRLIVAVDRNHAPRILALGALAWMASDVAYMVAAPPDTATRLFDIGWMGGAILIGCGPWLTTSAPDVETSVEDAIPRLSRLRLVVSVAPLLVPPLIDLAGHRRSQVTDSDFLVVASAALVAITFARTLHLVRSREGVADRLQARERYYGMLAASSSDAVLVMGPDGRIRNDVPALGALLGRDVPSTVGLDAFDLVAPVDRDGARSVLAQVVLAPDAPVTGVVAIDDGDGHRRWFGVRVVNLLDDPVVSGVVVALHDTTAQKRAEDELAHQAFHDPLTGLANRVLFREHLDQALRRHAGEPDGPGVILLDLDGFKAVNDTFGHDHGDILLCEVGLRLGTIVRPGDTVARLGGDEFAILVDPREHEDVLAVALDVAASVATALADPVVLAGRQVIVTASVGIDVAHPRADAGTMLRNADIAMYRAKAEGKARVVAYDPGMRIDAVERFELENDAAHALDRGELRLVYQPVIALPGGRVVGVEALLRWDHPEQGPVPPDRFVPVLEATGQIVRVGAWVLHQALHTAAGWRATVPGHAEVQVAVNVSGHQLADADFVNCVRRELDGAGIPPGALVLEITETALVRNPATAAARLAELRDLGVILAMDDFGTGYSSLSYLRQFPVHVLKIDRSFTATMPEGEHMPALVAALLDLGRALGLEVVAEGIERPDQRDRLAEAGCHFGQGYLFSRPVGAADLAALLEAGVANGPAAAPLSTTW